MANGNSYGARVIGEALKEGGVECLFGVHGVINLAIEEANALGVKMYHFRHEQSAGFAADAYARCLRRPGVCFASTAPGFANYVSPIAQAKGALSPVVLLIGQHGISGDGLNTIQEGYGTEVFKSVSKWTHRSLDWNLHSHWVRRALAESTQYPPGPVVLEFPRNTLNVRGPERQLKNFPPSAALTPAPSQGNPAEVKRAVQMLLAAERPVLIAGDGVYWSDGMRALKALAEFLQIPVHSRRTARGAVAENHPLAFTGGYRSELLRNADVVCLVGLRATWLEEWFELPEWNHAAKYIQVQETIGEIWPALPSEVAVVGSCATVLEQMLDFSRQIVTAPPQRDTWLVRLAQARERFKLRQREAVARQAGARPLHPHTLGASIAEFLDPSATVIYDSFTGTTYLTDKLEAKFSGQILDAGLHQPVGHGIGMCIGAQIARPGKQVLTLMGDGGFGISAMDMETMLRYKLPAVVVVLNNDSWAGVSSGLDQFFHRMDSTDNLPGVRYDRMFRELGCHTEHVERAEQIGPALERSFNSGVASVINVVCDTTDIHPLRLRVAFGDTWARGNADKLPPEAAAQLRSVSSLSGLRRVQKFWIDNGLHIPLEELAAMAGVSAEKLVDD